MTKKEFLKITHKRTHKRVKEWLKSHTPNNIILRYLWIALSLLIRAIIAIVGRITYFITLRFIDIEFDIKYMEVEIEVLGLSPAEAHEYLKKKEQKINHLGASQFSTLSAKRGRKIEKANKYMYNIYPAPPVVEDDTKHNEIIGKFSDVGQKITTVAEDTQQLDILKNIDEKVDDLQQGTNTTVKNTEMLVIDSKIKESNQIERDKTNEDAKARFNEMVEQRDKTAKEQTSSPVPNHFEPNLSLEQVQIIVEYMNDMELFNVVVTDNDLIQVLMCENKKPLQTNNNRELARLLNKLSKNGHITTKWKLVARDNYCFISKMGEHISSNDFYSANSNSNNIFAHKKRLIDECIAALK